MPNPKVYIDGSAGTTGLRIQERLANRRDLDLNVLSYNDRRDEELRREATAAADLTILCLPDDAAVEAAAWASESNTKVVDASTAHRVNDDWTFGLPEMTPTQREKIRSTQNVSNPGCYPTGMILSLRPIIENGLLGKDAPITIHALSGYTGGGKKLIAKWEDERSDLVNLPFESPYALHTQHKHVPEMTKYAGLTHDPQFMPSVGPFPTGMRLEIPLHKAVLPETTTANDVWEVLDQRYANEQFIKINGIEDSLVYADPAFDPRSTNDTNRCDISIVPNALGHILIVIQIDNLGKGASGAAVQNMNLMLGLPENAGLKA
ncbi:MAG: N-acetyl-gamma-glutamyl-phosphate reductase [Dehalococcoidia bacterium]|jgi:N-acetyl-gamma-glutamyl-phosphate reductase|nr:N-acetyl-gamma-glutamyl-phosphate reductase [Dehalococcoidia bacterium]MDP7089958.1 N-acetyl-gamma-glutamyl-phosphate reductase [Dehalococcoidia bacterium]MDP7210700.1 N-acetyl-gamma-glutamyl-phosphate reductase [Vicinamibacterales bacterium]MDP7485468.1 N-acetyl-gamma-glutamyl-phosphate reductase [Dehalococcoidia bacterium]|tara:strand:- start:2698 stop:3657 length:960 start_codon:yes stop_codon:yes gene_type:complete